MNKKTIIGLSLLMLLFVMAYFAYGIYATIFSPNVELGSEDSIDLQIPTGSTIKDLSNLLVSHNIIDNSRSFKKVASWMSFGDSNVKPGNFTIKNGLSNRELINKLRSGVQTPIKLTFNQLRKLENLAGEVSKYVEMDSLSFLDEVFAQIDAKQLPYTKENVLSLFIPNTYELYWNTDAKGFINRMKKEHDRFWSKGNRLDKLKELNLTQAELYTLASIVEKETQNIPERPIIAGVYINRIKKGMKLEADPTVVYATGKFDLRRVLYKHLEFDSPYNTYKYAGLPPGPIFTPDISSIDACLNYKQHKFIFFCAKPGYEGTHSFARTNREHEKNANIYRRWLTANKIR